MKFSGGVLGGLLFILCLGGTAGKLNNSENIQPEDNPTPIGRLYLHPDPLIKESYDKFVAKPENKELFNNLAVCWGNVIELLGKYNMEPIQVGYTNWQPRYFCANVPNGWWDAAAKVTVRDNQKNIIWHGRDYYTPGATFWLGEPNFDHWLARPSDPFILDLQETFKNYYQQIEDAYKPYLIDKLVKSKGLASLSQTSPDGMPWEYAKLMLEANKKRRDVVEEKGLFWKVSVTGIGIKNKGKDKDGKESVAMILKGWYHLHVSIAQHNNEPKENPKTITLANNSGDYIIDRLMISARGVRLIQRPEIHNRISPYPYLIKGVTGGVGRFVTDFPGCTFRHEDHPIGGETVLPPNEFVREQELPCGSTNSFTHEVGNNFIYVRTDASTKGKYGGDGKDKTDLHVNFRIGHPPCGHVYELDFVVVGVVVKKDKDKDIKRTYFEESLEDDPSVLYIQRSMSTRFHFIKNNTMPKFFGAPDPIPITINPKDLSCSVELQEEPEGAEAADMAGPESFFGAIKKIQRLGFPKRINGVLVPSDPFAELNDPSKEVFNPITVMYPDLYSLNDLAYYGKISKAHRRGKPTLQRDYLYFRYFKAMIPRTMQDDFDKTFPTDTKEQLWKRRSVLKDYCNVWFFTDGDLRVAPGYPEPTDDRRYYVAEYNETINPSSLYVSPFRQLIDPLTRFPLWDFTCVGGGGVQRYTSDDYQPALGQFTGNCYSITRPTAVGYHDLPHVSCDYGLNGAEISQWNEAAKKVLDWSKYRDSDKSLAFFGHYYTYTRYLERYDATYTVRKYYDNSTNTKDWEEYTLGGELFNFNDVEKQKNHSGHRKLNLELCETAFAANKEKEETKCLVLPPRPFTETPPPSTEAPKLKKEVAALLGLGEGESLTFPPDDEELKGGDDGDRGNPRNSKRNKKAKRVKDKSTLIPGPQKGKAIDDDLSLFEWDTRIFHGAVFTLLTTFVIPVNAFMTRYFKETFMQRRILNLRVWYFFHLMAAVAIPSIFIVGLARGLMTSGFLGHSYSAAAVWHRALGWLSAALSLAMVFFGWMRHMNLKINWIIVALHWFVGYLIYLLMMICTLLSIWIPGSPSAYFDVTYAKFSTSNLGFEIVFMCIVIFLAFDIIMHIILTMLTHRNDRLMLLNGPRLYLPAPIPVLAENSTFDAPGYGCRKITLIIYVCVASAATATIITVMCLYSPLDRGFGAMTCVNPTKDPSIVFPEYPESC